MKEMAKCPFCAEEKDVYMMSVSRKVYRVACSKCGSCGAPANIDDYGGSKTLARAAAVAKWNRRAEHE